MHRCNEVATMASVGYRLRIPMRSATLTTTALLSEGMK